MFIAGVSVVAGIAIQFKLLSKVSVKARLQWRNAIPQSFGLALATVQTISLLNQLGLLGREASRDQDSIDMQDHTTGAGEEHSGMTGLGEAFLDSLMLKPSMLSPPCFVGYDPVAEYGFRIGMFFSFGIIFGCFAAVAKLRRWQSDDYHSVRVGLSSIRLAFIPIILNCSLVLQSYSHPKDSNGSGSLTDYPTVLVGSDQHFALLVLSAVMLISVAVPFISVCLWGAMQGLQKLGKVRFEQVFLFMLQRFQPSLWWFETFLILNNLVLAFAPVVSADDPQGQCLFVLATFLVSMVFTCTFRPWKSQELNILNIVILLMFVLTLLARLASLPTSLHIESYYTCMSAAVWLLVACMVLGCVATASAPVLSKATNVFGRPVSYFQQPDGLVLAAACQDAAKEAADKERFQECLDGLGYYDAVHLLQLLVCVQKACAGGANCNQKPGKMNDARLASEPSAFTDLNQKLDQNELRSASIPRDDAVHEEFESEGTDQESLVHQDFF
eukprot:TRINITY_DN13651_c0_g2_i2.p1 TRINITY_DN13651_c0_g2~~TRINITY_DN13651_c0_g2_i2.p1  ORF type:complete len:500 (+),score=76.74 TRINITY_DN13651_c0_g2_i2:958-2457(+)